MAYTLGSGSNKRVIYTGDDRAFVDVQCYMYFHHLDKYMIIPLYPNNVQDQMTIQMPNQSILGRSAPIFTYSSSGPRTVNFSMTVHRDMLRQVNLTNGTITSDDYIDTLIKLMQACTVPEYSDPQKLINPPVVTLRIVDEIYIKGVIQGQVGIRYKAPVLNTVFGKKYSQVEVGFNIAEFDPFSASQIAKYGSFRGYNSSMDSLGYNSDVLKYNSISGANVVAGTRDMNFAQNTTNTRGAI